MALLLTRNMLLDIRSTGANFLNNIKSFIAAKTSHAQLKSFEYRFRRYSVWDLNVSHYNDIIMSMIASQITSLTIVYSTVYSGADQRKHQNSASLAFVQGIHREPVNSPHKGSVTRKMFPFDDVIMIAESTDHTPEGAAERVCARWPKQRLFPH